MFYFVPVINSLSGLTTGLATYYILKIQLVTYLYITEQGPISLNVKNSTRLQMMIYLYVNYKPISNLSVVQNLYQNNNEFYTIYLSGQSANWSTGNKSVVDIN